MTSQRQKSVLASPTPLENFSAQRAAWLFMQMMREQTEHQLDAWLSSAEASRLPELESLARGIQHDKAAVQAGLTLPWSTGPRDRHVNRRQHPEKEHVWSCQAPLLRARVLHVAEKEPSRVAILTG